MKLSSYIIGVVKGCWPGIYFHVVDWYNAFSAATFEKGAIQKRKSKERFRPNWSMRERVIYVYIVYATIAG